MPTSCLSRPPLRLICLSLAIWATAFLSLALPASGTKLVRVIPASKSDSERLMRLNCATAAR